MIKHIILWQFKDNLTNEEKQTLKKEIKKGLEDLKGKVDGLIDIQVITDGLSSSNADIMLDSTLTNEAALQGYAVNPDHVKVKDGVIAPNVKARVCMDYEI